jgi:ABC-2 type transport system permease protein
MSTLSLALPRPTASRRTAFAKIVRNEVRLAWRRPVGLIAGAGIPVLLVVIFGNVAGFQQPMPGYGTFTIFDAYVPILAVFAIAMIALLGLPVPLASYRELGVLRRLSTTPIPRTWLLAAQGVVQLGMALIALVVIFGVSITVLGAQSPVSPAGLVLSIGLSAVGLFPIGLIIAAVARTANAASIVGRLAFFPLMFFAGLWLPQDLMPALLRDISDYTPLGAAVQAIQSSMLTGFPPIAPLLVLAGYAVVFGFLARRFFRWE